MAELPRLALPDGRLLEYRVDGPTGGDVLLFHHGTPGVAAPAPYLTDAAVSRGLRVVTASRPGYGGSSPHPGRRVADVAADGAALLDHLGVGTFVTTGWSGGGPHALATAVLLADRCLAVSTIAGVAPSDAVGLDWSAGMGEENVEEFELAGRGLEALGAGLEAIRAGLGPLSVASLIESMGGLLPEADRRVLDGPIGAELVHSMTTVVTGGVEGWRDDDLAFVGAWGVDPTALTVPVTVWQGEEDLMVPVAHGRWLGAHLPSVTARIVADHGHLSLVAAFAADIVDDLCASAARAGRSPS